MSKKVGSLVIDIKADTARIITDVERLSRTFDSSMSAMERSTGRVQQSIDSLHRPISLAADSIRNLQSILAVLGVGLSASNVIEYADSWKTLAARIQIGAGVSAANAQTLQMAVFKMAQDMRVNLNDAGTAFFKISSIVKDLGGNTTQALKVTEVFAKALKIGGATSQEAAASILQFGQALSSGKLNGDEFKSLSENAPFVMKKLSEQLGMTQGALRSMSTEGKLTSDVIVNAFLKMSEAVNRDAGQIPVTVADGFVKMENAAREWVGSADSATGASAVLSRGLSALADDFGGFATGMINTAAVFAALYVGKMAGAMSDRVAASAALRAENVQLMQSDVAAANSSLSRAKSLEVQAAAAKAAALSEAELAAAEVAAARIKTAQAAQSVQAAQMQTAMVSGNGSSAEVKRALDNEAAAIARLEQAKALETAANTRLAQSGEALNTARETHARTTDVLTQSSQRFSAAQVEAARASSFSAAASRAAEGVMAALGGPIGIAITALTLLALNWDKVADATVRAGDSAAASMSKINAALKASKFAAAADGVAEFERSMSQAEAQIARIDKALKIGPDKNLEANRAAWQTIYEQNREKKLQAQKLIADAKETQREAALALLPKELKLKDDVDGKKAVEEWQKSHRDNQQIRADELKQQKEWLDKKLITEDQYNKNLAVIREKYKDKSGSKPKKGPASGMTGQQSELASIHARIKAENEQAQALAAAASSGAASYEKLNEGEKLAIQYAEKLTTAKGGAAKAHWAAMKAAADELAQVQRNNAGRAEYLKLEAHFAELSEQRTQSQALLNEEAKKEWEWMGLTAIQRTKAQAAWEEEKAIRAELLDLQKQMVDAIGSESKALIQRQIDLVNAQSDQRMASAAARAEARAAQSEWSQMTGDISRSMTDALVKGLSDGHGAIDNFFDYLKKTAQTTLIKIAVQPVQAALGALGGQIFGGMQGGAGVAGGGVGSAAGLYGIVDAFTNSKAQYSQIVQNTLLSSAGQSLGFATPTMYSIGENISGGIDAALIETPPQLTALGENAKLAGEALAYLPAVMSAADGQWGRAAGQAAGQYFGGPLGAMLGGELGGMVDGFFGGGGPDERKAKFGSGASAALVAEGKATGWTGESSFGAFRTYADQWFGAEMQPLMAQFVDQLEAIDGSVSSALHMTGDQTARAIDALSGLDKTYSFGEQWTDFTQSSKAREQIAIDRYSTILNSIESGWGDFLASFSGSFDQFPAYLDQVVAAMDQFRTNKNALIDLFGEQINAIGDFSKVARSGENNAAAFQRLAGVFGLSNRAADMLGKSTQNAFGVMGLASASLRESLVNAAGGADQLNSKLQSYASSYLLESERRARAENDIRKVLAEVNIALPDSREAFRKVIESLDFGTAAGQKAFAALMGVNAAFAELTPALDAAKMASGGLLSSYESQTAVVKKLADDAKKWLELRNSAGGLLDSLDSAIGRTPQFAAQRQSELWAQMSGASIEQQISLAGELSTLILDRYQLEKTNLESLRDTAKSLRQYVLGLMVGDLSPYTMSERLAEAASQYAIGLAQAQTGDQTALAALQGRADAYLGLAKDYYASGSDYRQIFDAVSGGLDQLGVTLYDSSTASTGAASSQLAELQRLRDAVQSAYTQSNSAYQQAATQLQSEFAVLSQIAAQLGRLSDIRELLASLPIELSARLQPLLSGAGGVGAGGRPLETVYQTDYGYRYDSSGGAYATKGPNDAGYIVSGTTGAAISGASAVSWVNDQLARGDGVAVYNAAKQNGISAQTLDAMMGWAAGTANSWAAANNLPKFAVGTNYVPQDMPAIIHEGERIFPAADNRRLFDLLENPSGGSSGEIAELRRELSELRQMTGDLLRVLIDVTAGSSADNAERIVSALERQEEGQAWRERNRPVLS